ncbi:MAG: carbohydrate binding domain-containing protein [archaeon]|nr:carbohydrate binding domain-containing protein [archaeon]
MTTKNIFTKGIFALILISLISISFATAISNNSFEASNTNYTSWAPFPASIGIIDISNTEAYSGNNSARLYNAQSDSPYNVLTQTVSVKSNTVYKLSGYIKSNLTSGACQIDFYKAYIIDTDGIPLVNGSSNWHRYEETFTTPNLTSGQIRLLQVPAIGSCYFDDIQLEEILQQNTNPVLNGIPDKTINENSGFQNNIINLSDYASDNENSDPELTFTITNQTNSGLINCFIDSGKYINCEAPANNQTGTNTITVKVTDADGATDTDSFRIEVIENAINENPVLSGIPDVYIMENDGSQNNIIDLYNYASDAEDTDSELIFIIVNQTDSGLIFCEIDQDRYIDCDPPRFNDSGSNTITVEVTDRDGATDTAVFRVIVEDNGNGNNTAPTISNLPDLSIEENSGARNNWVDIYSYAFDNEDSDSELDFRISNQSNKDLIYCTIDQDRYFECEAPRADRTGTSTITIEAEDSDGATVSDTFTVKVNPQNSGVCGDIDIATRTIFINEDDSETIRFDIRNNGNDDFRIFDATADVTYNDSYLDSRVTDFDTLIREDGEGEVELKLESFNVSMDKEATVRLRIRGEFDNGSSCSFSNIEESFRVWINNDSSGNGVCDDIGINASDVTIAENSSRTKIIKITNDNSRSFEIDDIIVSENNSYFNISTLNEPEKISANSNADLELKIYTNSVTSDKSGDVEIKVSGKFSNGVQCTSSKITDTFKVTVDNTDSGSSNNNNNNNNTDEEDFSGSVKVDFSNSFAVLEQGQTKNINVTIKNGLDEKKCFDLSANDTPIFTTSLSSSEICVSGKGSETISMSITGKNSGTDNVRFEAQYDGISKIKFVSVEVSGNDSGSAEERPQISIPNNPEELFKDNEIILTNTGSELRNVTIRALNAPEGINIEEVNLDRWETGETLGIEVAVDPGFNDAVNITLSVSSDSGTIGIPVKFTASEDQGFTGLVGLATTAGMAIGLIIIVVLAILGILSVFSKK